MFLCYDLCLFWRKLVGEICFTYGSSETRKAMPAAQIFERLRLQTVRCHRGAMASWHLKRPFEEHTMDDKKRSSVIENVCFGNIFAVQNWEIYQIKMNERQHVICKQKDMYTVSLHV